MKEYIMPIDDTAFDLDEMFVCVIRKQEELIRCKECKHFDKDEFCHIWEAYRTNESYCDIAERKEEWHTC